ncbi:hypothetical protein HYZ98_04025 [Candidatus Peregrinibacteria bacterium]|nr:hypothetical protein [Candidatus Peregrinibacteria bacterium]
MTAEQSSPSAEEQVEAHRILGKTFTKNEAKAVDPDRIFYGLFTDPADTNRVQCDQKCLIGRVQELCCGEPTPEQLLCIVEVSRVPGLEPVRRIVYALLARGTLDQKKKAARALASLDPAAAAIVNGLDQLVDKPTPKPEEKKPESPRFVCGTELVSGR